jgi:Ca-activated chloride channel family protein
MVESQSTTSPAIKSAKPFRLTPRRLGLALLAPLLVGTVSLGVLQARSGHVTSGARDARSPQGAALRGAAPPVALNARKASPDLPAPPPAQWIRNAGSAVGFAATLDRGAVARGSDGLVRVELVMKADQVAEQARVASDFVVVLDRSGSMAGERIAQARAAITTLLGQLSERDRFALVTYDDSPQVAIPLSLATPGSKREWRNVVSDIETGDSTNMSGGLDEGLALMQAGRQAGRAGRVILLSDGHANAGDTSPEGLRERGKRASQHELVLSTVGIGTGFNEFLMSQVADAGTGNFHYLADNSSLASIFERELSSTRATVASALRVNIAPGSGVAVVDAAGYPLETGDAGTSFQVGSLYSGQERRVWLTLRVPVEREAELQLGELQLSYVEAGASKQLALGHGLALKCVSDEATALASIDKSAWERSVAQEEWGRVQQEVARAVHEGQRQQAIWALQTYRAKQAAVNSTVGSVAVSKTLAETEAVERQVVDAFAGENQAWKQNAFSKQNLAEGRGKRRVGSVRGIGSLSY